MIVQVRQVHRFEVDGKRYVLDLDSGALIRLDERADRALSVLESRDGAAPLADAGDAEAVLELESAGLVSESPKDDLLPGALAVPIPKARLILALSAPHAGACAYTWHEAPLERRGEGGHPSAKAAMDAVTRLFAESGGRRVLLVDLHLDGAEEETALLPVLLDHVERLSQETGKSVRLHALLPASGITEAAASILAGRFSALTVLFDHADLAATPDLASPLTALIAQMKERIRARLVVGRGGVPSKAAFDLVVARGFSRVGVSLLGASGKEALEPLRSIMEAAIEEALAGRAIRFEVLRTILVQIHRGESRAVPCGAGSAGFGASARTGGDAPCHRFLVDRGAAGAAFAESITVFRKAECRGCLARPFCAGGCPHEAALRFGSTAAPNLHLCDLIRGVVETALEAYVRIAQSHPEILSRLHEEGID